MKNNFGFVVIGRNEGERFKACLGSLREFPAPIVYVDSGSTDGSCEYAQSQAVEVVRLDMAKPFSAGRARNEGFQYLTQAHPELEYVQFIDGDCLLYPAWIRTSLNFLKRQRDVAIACGRRREIRPEASVYNRLCDMEWDTPLGTAGACGGDFMARVSAFNAVEGFNPNVVAGEEPELCLRLRESGWLIERLDADMTWHDAAIFHFSGFWNRAKRSGHAFAQGYQIHGESEERFCYRELRTILFWSLALPAVIILAFAVVPSLALMAASPYVVLLSKITLYRMKHFKNKFRNAVTYALFNLIGKFAQLSGVAVFIYRSLLNKEFRIIEYK